MKRKIKPLNISMGQLVPALPDTPPEIRWVDPSSLLIDDQYQREMSRDSVTLIRKIIANWTWAKFKPPICSETPEGLEVVDGQHTATAAASHPNIDKIPVLVVFTPTVANRAEAFVGHNRDRINVTGVQVYYAMLAAGDEHALTIKQVCERAGVKIMKYPPPMNAYKPGQTMAIQNISGLVNKYHAQGARVILEVAAKANLSPVSGNSLKAISHLLHSQEYKGKVEPDQITSAFIALGPEATKEARLFAATHSIEQWRALAIVLYREVKKRGRKVAA